MLQTGETLPTEKFLLNYLCFSLYLLWIFLIHISDYGIYYGNFKKKKSPKKIYRKTLNMQHKF